MELKLTKEILNNTKCNGCVQSILSPFYSCTQCSFFLHKSCSELPKIKWHPIDRHPLTLNYTQASFFYNVCHQQCNGLKYNCQLYNYNFNVPCILLLDTLTHACHEHRLYLSLRNYEQKCSSCNSKMFGVFHCATCKFVLDFKCANYHKPHGTTNMNILSLFVILLKITPVNITMISVKKNEILSNGFTTIRIAIFLLIATVFLGTHQMSSNV